MRIDYSSEHIINIDGFACTNLVDWSRLNEVNAIMIAKSSTEYMVVGGIALRYAVSKTADFTSFVLLCAKLCQRLPTINARVTDNGVFRVMMRQLSVIDSWSSDTESTISGWDKVYQVYFGGSNLVGGRNVPNFQPIDDVGSETMVAVGEGGSYISGGNGEALSSAMLTQPWAYATFPIYLDYQTTGQMLDVAKIEAASAGDGRSQAEAKMRDIISKTKDLLGDVVNYQPYLLADYVRVGNISGFGNMDAQLGQYDVNYTWRPRVYPDGLVLPSYHQNTDGLFEDATRATRMQATLTRANINGILYAEIVAGIEQVADDVTITDWTTQTLLGIATNRWRMADGVMPTIDPLVEGEIEGTNYQRALDNHVANAGVLSFHPGENSLPGGASMTWCVLTAVADGTVSDAALADVFSYTYAPGLTGNKITANQRSVATGHSARKSALDVLIKGR